MIVDKYGNYVRKIMWQLCRKDRVDISLTVHTGAILKIVKSICNGKKIKCTLKKYTVRFFKTGHRVLHANFSTPC
jgi:hypothetical protein